MPTGFSTRDHFLTAGHRCERNNEWVDEGPYHIDTTTDGPPRRRKTMDPNALANNNFASGSSVPQSAPNTPLTRRSSAVWERTPSEHGDEDGHWEHDILTPVPVTPAPEAIARYVEGITYTPSEGSEAPESEKKDLVMMTCPPKKREQVKESIFSGERDRSVVERLMAARRKSLQFAPKVASPLSKAWR